MTVASPHEQHYPGNGVDIHVCQIGAADAPPLMMIHGICGRWESWNPVIDIFAQEYRLIIVDLRGHGRSSKPEIGYGLTDYAADMASVLDALNLTSIPVVGHSLGALTTAWLAADYPELVSAAVLEDPPGRFARATGTGMQTLLDVKKGPEETTFQYFRELNPQLGEERWRDQTFRLRNTADGPFEAVIQWLEHDNPPDTMATLTRVTCPVLLMQSDPEAGGVLVDEDAQEAIQNLQRGELTSFPGVGHNIHKDHPEQFASSVLEFLNRHH